MCMCVDTPTVKPEPHSIVREYNNMRRADRAPQCNMGRRPTRSVRTHILALTLAICFSLGSPLVNQLLPVSAGAVLSRATAVTAMRAQRTRTAAGRRRARPAWQGHNHSLHPSAFGAWRDWSTRTSGRGDPAALAAAPPDSGEDRVPANAAAAAAVAASSGVTPAARMPPPLTHDQLPEESIYLLDGTSMLFRAFYGRGAGG